MIQFSRVPVSPRLLQIAAILGLAVMCLFAQTANAANRERVQAFLTTTGFDVALDSIAFSAASAPQMLGVEPDVFGSDWNRVTAQVFKPEIMRDIALDILEQTLSDENLAFAAGVYASDLGQRLVEAEDASHMLDDDDAKMKEGNEILAELAESNPDRLDLMKRMNAAISSVDSSLRALQEIQVRFLMSASAAGVVELQLDADELRAMIAEDEERLRVVLEQSAMSGSAYTYRDISDEDLLAYTEALEEPQMQEVYELLNAVQYEIMANRFEVLAAKMANLHPGQDI